MGTTDVTVAESVDIDLGEYQRPDESDRDALERALAEIASVGAGTLYLPPGRYTIRQPLVVAGAYVTIAGDPGTIVHLHLTDADKVDTRTHVFALTGEIHRACFRGLTIIGPGAPEEETGGARGACIGTADGALVHSLVVEDCVLSDRIVGVRVRFAQSVRGPFRFRRNRIRRVVRGIEMSTLGDTAWSGATARDVRFERNHVLVERGTAAESRGLTTVATLDVRLWANNLSGAGMAFEQASPWFGFDLEHRPPLPSASEFPTELLAAVGLDSSRPMSWELRHRIQTRYNFMSLTLSQTHDLSYNVFDARRQSDERNPWDDNGAVAPIAELSHTFPVASGNLLAHYRSGRFFALRVARAETSPSGPSEPSMKPLTGGGTHPPRIPPLASVPISFQGITTRRRGVTAVGNVFEDLPEFTRVAGAFTLSPGETVRQRRVGDEVFEDPAEVKGSSVLFASLVEGCNRFAGFPSAHRFGQQVNDSLVVGANVASQLAKEAVYADGWRTVSLNENVIRDPYEIEVVSNRSQIAAVLLEGCHTATVSTNSVTQPADLEEDQGYSRPLRLDRVEQISATANLFANATLAAKLLTPVPVASAAGGATIDVVPVTTVVGTTVGIEADNVLSYRIGEGPPVDSTQLLPIISGETP